MGWRGGQECTGLQGSAEKRRETSLQFPTASMDSDEDLLLALAEEEDTGQAQAEAEAAMVSEQAHTSKASARQGPPTRKRPRGGTPGRAPPPKVATKPDSSTPSLAVREKGRAGGSSGDV